MASLIVPLPSFLPPPEEDCARLKKASESFLRDEKTIVSILGHRNAEQIKVVKETYQQLYDHSLLDDLNSKLSGDLRNALVLWVHEPEVRHAMLANKALKAMTNKIRELQVVVEIACGNKTVYVNGVREAYIDLYGCTIEEDILDCVYDMPLKKSLLALISSNRHSKETTKKEIAVEDASKIHEAIRKRRLDDDSFLWILSTRSISQLRETFATYQQLFHHSLEQDIANCGEDDLENLLIAAIRCTCNPEKHFAKVIRESMIGIGTDEESLNRAIVSRAEVDMLKIEIEYAAMFDSNLVKDVCGDTSGSYQNFLMTLMGKDPLE
ncbi:hypothetical protein S245_064369 [Arachis hypogaea]|nr:Annexin [Arachis hypogaea]